MQPATRTAIGLPRGFEIHNFTVDSMWRIMDTNFIMVITKQTIWLKDYFFVKYNYLSGYGNKRVEDLLLLLDGDINRFEESGASTAHPALPPPSGCVSDTFPQAGEHGGMMVTVLLPPMRLNEA